MALFLVGYDIADPKRLARIHRVMCNHATPLQYSIFLLEGSEKLLEACLDAVLPIMHASADDVRCYRLPARGLQCRLGSPVVPSGIVWTALPAPVR